MPKFIIDGKTFETEESIRDYCAGIRRVGGQQQQMDNGAFETTGGKISHDFRLQSQAYRAPVSALLAMLQATGHSVEEV